MRITGLFLAAGFALTPVLADTTFEVKKPLEPGGRFVLDTAAGSVNVRGTSSSGARIVVHSRRDDLRDLYDFKFEEGPGEVRVTIQRNAGLSSWFRWTESMDITVEVPKATHIDLQTSGGSIDVEDLAKDAKIATSGGSIEVERLDANLDAGTSGGSIRLVQVAGDADVSTSGGSIYIEGAGGKVNAGTSGGGIEARFAPGNARGGSLATSGGGVRVFVDPSIDLTLDAETSGGNVRSTLPGTVSSGSDRSSLRATIGKGGETLRIRSSGGSIRIEPN